MKIRPPPPGTVLGKQVLEKTTHSEKVFLPTQNFSRVPFSEFTVSVTSKS